MINQEKIKGHQFALVAEDQDNIEDSLSSSHEEEEEEHVPSLKKIKENNKERLDMAMSS